MKLTVSLRPILKLLHSNPNTSVFCLMLVTFAPVLPVLLMIAPPVVTTPPVGSALDKPGDKPTAITSETEDNTACCLRFAFLPEQAVLCSGTGTHMRRRWFHTSL